MKVCYPGPHDAVEFALEAGGLMTVVQVERDGFADVPESMGIQLVAQGWIPGDEEAQALVDAARAVIAATAEDLGTTPGAGAGVLDDVVDPDVDPDGLGT